MKHNDVSAIVPVKNGAFFIETTILRILGSLERNDELLVIDDNSSDNSFELLDGLRKNDSRIKLLRNTGKGIVDALNYGVSESNSELIARFDIDDEYEFNRIARQREYIQGNVVAVFCDYNIVDFNSRYLGTIFSPVFPSATKLSLVQNLRTPHPAVLFSKSAFLKAGGYRSGDEGVEDLSLWLRMSEFGELVSVPEVLFSYRIHRGSTTVSNRERIIKKRSNLLQEFSDSWVDLKLFRVAVTESFPKYKDMTGAYQRIVLLSRELLLVGTKRDRFISLLYVCKELVKVNPFKMVMAALQLGAESRRRKKIRLG